MRHKSNEKGLKVFTENLTFIFAIDYSRQDVKVFVVVVSIIFMFVGVFVFVFIVVTIVVVGESSTFS